MSKCSNADPFSRRTATCENASNSKWVAASSHGAAATQMRAMALRPMERQEKLDT
jgi:hypothetical protein